MTDAIQATIPLPPAALSPNARVHWAKRAKATKAHRFAAFVAFAAAKREAKWKHMRPIIVDIEYRCCKAAKGYAPKDAQNALSSLKASFDALQDACIVPNDSARWLTLGKVELLTRAADPRVKALGAGVTFTIREYP